MFGRRKQADDETDAYTGSKRSNASARRVERHRRRDVPKASRDAEAWEREDRERFRC